VCRASQRSPSRVGGSGVYVLSTREAFLMAHRCEEAGVHSTVCAPTGARGGAQGSHHAAVRVAERAAVLESAVQGLPSVARADSVGAVEQVVGSCGGRVRNTWRSLCPHCSGELIVRVRRVGVAATCCVAR
jgi:hypothetical protein